MERVDTIWGPFGRPEAERLHKVLNEAEAGGASTTTLDGRPLDVQFGRYLLEFVDQSLGIVR